MPFSAAHPPISRSRVDGEWQLKSGASGALAARVGDSSFFLALRPLAPAPALLLARETAAQTTSTLHQCERHLYVNARKAMAAGCMPGDQGLHELLNRAITSTEAGAASEVEVRADDGRRALNRWARHWAPVLGAEVWPQESRTVLEADSLIDAIVATIIAALPSTGGETKG